MLKDDASPSRPIEWAATAGLVPYETAVRFMEARADLVARGAARELIWLVEHAALYTAGTSARDADLVEPSRLPVYRTGRGGQFTYHGPGQRIAYVMLDVRRRFGGNIRTFVRTLEDWIIATLAGFGIEGETRCERIGVWVKGASAAGTQEEAKIAALGIRVRHGVSFHGIAINVAPDLSHYAGIVPCGIREHGVTSLAALGIGASMKDVDILLKKAFEARLGLVATVADPLPAFIAAARDAPPARP